MTAPAPHDPAPQPFRFPTAARYSGMESSPLKDIFALAALDGVVSFAGGSRIRSCSRSRTSPRPTTGCCAIRGIAHCSTG
ncbi:hypothetical protein [Brachybacterium avium]|uniref:hypothetical protein n=1 Tax=Brachybacterium avium TaxID=2017485 RepID=UPI001FE55AB6|nr:hypothetical protein [Brachybacterium avium]